MWPVRDSRFLVQKTERRKSGLPFSAKVQAWNQTTNEDQSSISMNFFMANILDGFAITGYKVCYG